MRTSTVPANSYGTLIATGTLGVNSVFIVLLSSSGYIYLWSYGYAYYFTTGPYLIDGQWHSIAITYDGAGSLSLYIDHALIETATVFNLGPTVTINFNTVGDNNYLGTTYYGGYNYNYIGDLQNIAFYNYGLTASQATVDSITE